MTKLTILDSIPIFEIFPIIIQVEAPKLQVRVKMGSFRASLMEQLLNRFVHFLEEIQTSGDVDSGEHVKEIKVRLDSTSSCSSSSASPPGNYVFSVQTCLLIIIH